MKRISLSHKSEIVRMVIQQSVETVKKRLLTELQIDLEKYEFIDCIA